MQRPTEVAAGGSLCPTLTKWGKVDRARFELAASSMPRKRSSELIYRPTENLESAMDWGTILAFMVSNDF